MTRLEAIILGLLSERPLTGYEIISLIADSPSFGVRATAGSVYPALKRLEGAELVSAKDASIGKRPASQFSLTAKGTAGFVTWLKSPVSFGTTDATEDVLLRVLFSQHISGDELRSLLEAYGAGMRAQLAVLESLRPGWDALPARQRLCLLNGLISARAQVEWTEQALAELR